MKATIMPPPPAAAVPSAVVVSPPGTVVALPTLPNAVTPSANAAMETSGTIVVLRRIAAPSFRNRRRPRRTSPHMIYSMAWALQGERRDAANVVRRVVTDRHRGDKDPRLGRS